MVLPRWLCILLLVVPAGCQGGQPMSAEVTLSPAIGNGDAYMGVRWLGAVRVGQGSSPVPVTGLSDLAWDQDAGVLYAVSDQGLLFHLQPDFKSGYLTGVDVVAAFPLRNPGGAVLAADRRDAEGLALVDRGDQGSRLLVSFEGWPAVAEYTTQGYWRADHDLPAGLARAQDYSSPNSGLEALAVHPDLGILVGTERTPPGFAARQVPIASLGGRVWHYPLAAPDQSALTAFEVLEDGSLLTLERAYVSPWVPLVISLRRTCLDALGGGPLRVGEVAVFDAARKWRLDNFEGLTRHDGWRVLMVSDDNSNVLQATLLVYMEIDPRVSDCHPERGG